MDDRRVLISCRLVWEARDQVVPQLEAHGLDVDIPRFEDQQLREPDLLPIIDRYVGILAGDDHLTRSVLKKARNLRVISKWGVGVDAIDLDAAKEFGIQVFNTPGVFGEELADYAMGYIHLLARRQHEVNLRVRHGEWRKIRGVSLAGKTLGIIGLGSSGRELARRASAASMEVLGFDIAPSSTSDHYQIVELGDLLSRSDVVSLHLPATPDTRHLINEQTLSVMKSGAWLINISRGSLIDEDALVAALASGDVAAAALDVFEKEPIDQTHALFSFDQVIVGSHNGSNTEEAVARATSLAVRNLLRGLEIARVAP